MKYCPSCKSIITDDADACQNCSAQVADISADSAVTVATVKGTSVAILESSLKDTGIPCVFEKLGDDIYNELNAKVSAESDYKVLVPFEFYGKAFDICVGFGFAQSSDRLVPESDSDASDESAQTYDEKFEAVNGVKHRTWQMVWMVIFIVAACLLIWGVDWIAELIKGLL